MKKDPCGNTVYGNYTLKMSDNMKMRDMHYDTLEQAIARAVKEVDAEQCGSVYAYVYLRSGERAATVGWSGALRSVRVMRHGE